MYFNFPLDAIKITKYSQFTLEDCNCFFFAQHGKYIVGVLFRSVSFSSVQSSGVRRKVFTLQISAFFSEDRLTAVVVYIVTVIVVFVFAVVDRFTICLVSRLFQFSSYRYFALSLQQLQFFAVDWFRLVLAISFWRLRLWCTYDLFSVRDTDFFRLCLFYSYFCVFVVVVFLLVLNWISYQRFCFFFY